MFTAIIATSSQIKNKIVATIIYYNKHLLCLGQDVLLPIYLQHKQTPILSSEYDSELFELVAVPQSDVSPTTNITINQQV